MFEANLVFRFRCIECVDILCLKCVNIVCHYGQLTIFNLYFQS